MELSLQATNYILLGLDNTVLIRHKAKEDSELDVAQCLNLIRQEATPFFLRAHAVSAGRRSHKFPTAASADEEVARILNRG